VRDTVLVDNQKLTEYSKNALSSISTSSRTMNTSIPGMLGYKRHTEKQRTEEAKVFNEQYLGIIKG
jgi:hypothetical protein